MELKYGRQFKLPNKEFEYIELQVEFANKEDLPKVFQYLKDRVAVLAAYNLEVNKVAEAKKIKEANKPSDFDVTDTVIQE